MSRIRAFGKDSGNVMFLSGWTLTNVQQLETKSTRGDELKNGAIKPGRETELHLKGDGMKTV